LLTFQNSPSGLNFFLNWIKKKGSYFYFFVSFFRADNAKIIKKSRRER
jgi:hypothetical protein